MTDTRDNLFVVCIKWGKGYPGTYANILYRSVRDHLSLPHRFVCLTDDPSGLDAGIETMAIGDFPLPRESWARGMWPKLVMFRKGLFPDNATVIFLDPDIVITKPIDPMIEHVRKKGGLHIIREWNPALLKVLPVSWRPDRGSNSSVVAFIAGAQTHILDRFLEDPQGYFAMHYNDQNFINAFAADKNYWPYSWCQSFKRSCVWYPPFNRIFRKPRLPKAAKIMVFHGEPNPADLVRDDNSRWGSKRKFGFGPVDWVKEYWTRYAS